MLTDLPDPLLARANAAVEAAEQAAVVLAGDAENTPASKRVEVLATFKRAREAGALVAVALRKERDAEALVLAEFCERQAVALREFDSARLAGITQPRDFKRGEEELAGRPHGLSRYLKDKCKCEVCKSASREQKRALRARKSS